MQRSRLQLRRPLAWIQPTSPVTATATVLALHAIARESITQLKGDLLRLSQCTWHRKRAQALCTCFRLLRRSASNAVAMVHLIRSIGIAHALVAIAIDCLPFSSHSQVLAFLQQQPVEVIRVLKVAVVPGFGKQVHCRPHDAAA